MSTQASEIVTAMTTMLKQSLTDLHQQNINDVQVIVAKLELRMITEFDAIKQRIDALEKRRPLLESERGE